MLFRIKNKKTTPRERSPASPAGGLASRLIIFLGVVFLVTGVLLGDNHSKAAPAEITNVPLPTTVTVLPPDPTGEAKWTWDKAGVALKKAGAIAYRNGLKTFLNQMAADTATWIASGAKGQGPMFITEGWGTYMQKIGNSAAGTFMEDFAQAFGGEMEDYGKLEVLDEKRTSLGDQDTEARKKQAQCKTDAVTVATSCGQGCEQHECSGSGAGTKKCTECRQGCTDDRGRDNEKCDAGYGATKDSLGQQHDETIAASLAIEKSRKKRGEAGAGGYLETQPGHWGLDLANTLCKPTMSGAISINMGLAGGLGVTGGGGAGRAPTCTAEELFENWDNFVGNPDFLNRFQHHFDPRQNDVGIAMQTYLGQWAVAGIAMDTESTTFETFKGIKGVGSLIDTGLAGEGLKRIKTHPTKIEDVAKDTGKWAVTTFGEYTGEAVVDAIGTFADTLLVKFLQNIMQGDVTDEAMSVKGYALYQEAADIRGVSGLREAAEERFAQIFQPVLSGGGPHDVIQRLAQCENPDKPGFDSCVIGESFRSAIEHQKTLRQALDEGLLDPSGKFGYLADGKKPDYGTGYPYRSLVILRKYRVIPVGWELAALYIKKFGHQEMSLGQLVEAYDDAESPFYRLVDPNWVLKAPEHFCKKRGPGQEFNMEPEVQDDRIVLSRNEDFCVDEQSCIRENDDGSCQSWGYCAEEKRIWKFEAESCSDQFNTCRIYINSSGSQVSYLENTLDWNGCSIENVDCAWYCRDYNPDTEDWICTAPELVKERCTSERASYDREEDGCVVAKSCEALPGEDFCLTDDDILLTLPVPCTSETICTVSESCTIPEDGTECRVEACSDLGSLVVNPGFEDGTGTDAQAWVEFFYNSDHYQQRSTDKSKTGEYSIKSYSLGDVEELDTTSAAIDGIEPNNYYVARGKIFNSLSKGEARIEVVSSEDETVVKPCLKSDRTSTDDEAHISNKKDEWEEVRCYFASEIDSAVKIRLVVDQVLEGEATVNPEGSVWFDDLELVRECQLVPLRFDLGSEPKLDSEIYFDVDAAYCETEENGCSRFIGLGSGVNYLKNSSFEEWSGAADDGEEDDIFGWQGEGQIVSDGYFGSYAVKPKPLLGLYQASVETGESVADRTFTLSLQAKNCTDDDYYYISEGKYEFLDDPDFWESYSTTHTFSSQRTAKGFNIFVHIENYETSNCLIDAVMVEEGEYPSDYLDYGEAGNLYFKKAPEYFGCEDYLSDGGTDACLDYALSCQADEVGCELYTPINGEPSVPGIVEPEDYCPASCVGYDTYKEEASYLRAADYTYVIPSTAQSCNAAYAGCEEFTNLTTESLEHYSYLRQCQEPNEPDCTTYYTWEGDDKAGYQLAPHILKKGVAGAPYTVYDPDDEDPNCEINYGKPWGDDDFDLEITPDCRQLYDSEGNIFYRRYSQTVLCHEDCNLYRQGKGTESECQDSNGDWRDLEGDGIYECIYEAVPQLSLSCPEEANGCREYIGNTGYDLSVVLYDDFEDGTSEEWLGGEVSSESIMQGGHSLRVERSNEASKKLVSICELYELVDEELVLQTCEEEGCACGDDLSIDLEDLEGSDIDCWVENGEQSCVYQSLISSDKTYELSFQAQGPTQDFEAEIRALGVVVYSLNPDLDEDGVKDPLTLISDWKPYKLGPIELGELEENKEYELVFTGLTDSGTENYYFDNIILTEVRDSFYLIKDSWSIPVSCDNQLGDPYGKACGGSDFAPRRCSGPYSATGYCSADASECDTQGAACGPVGSGGICQELPGLPYMLGCQEYVDTFEEIHDLRSFSRLCREEVIGCQAMIDTQNSISPFSETFNPGDASLLIVDEDEIVYMVNDATKSCSAESKGCQAFGQPELDEEGEVLDFETVYIINDPDRYAQILCGSEEVGCKEFVSDEGIGYFKDPGLRICEYKQLSEKYGFGWYKQGTTIGPPDCPKAEDPEYRTIGEETGVDQPVGECVGGTPPTPNQCFSDADCLGPGGRCSFWVGLCPSSESGCTEYVDPVSYPAKNLIFNGDFEQELADCDGWTGGTCSDVLGVEDIEASGTLEQIVNINTERLYIISAEASAKGVDIEISNCGELSLIDDSMTSFEPTEGGDGLKVESTEEGKFSGRFYTRSSLIPFTCKVEIKTEGATVDNVELKEAIVDYQIVEGLDKASCNGVVNPDAGCVLLNERAMEGSSGYQSLVYDAQNTDVGDSPNYCTEDEAGCQADSNTLVKVLPDRTCDKWLYCSSAAQFKDPDNPQDTKERCFEVGLCNSLDENLNCDGFPYMPAENLTFEKANVDQLKDLSGFTKAGFDWSYEDETGIVEQIVEGFLPVNKMKQTGGYAAIPNGDFEQAGEGGVPLGWASAYPLETLEDSFWVVNEPAQAQKEAGLAPQGKGYLAINARLGPKLTAGPFTLLFPGEEIIEYDTSVITASKISVIPEDKYIYSALINTKNLIDGKVVIDVVEFDDLTGEETSVVTVPVELDDRQNWQRVVGEFEPEGDTIQVKVYGDETAQAVGGYFYIDDLQIKPTLELQKDSYYEPQSCRMYPKDDSLSCDYQDDVGYRYHGNFGYCLETDPDNSEFCELWWPVENILGDYSYEDVYYYYGEREPLYYCLNYKLLEGRRDFRKEATEDCPETTHCRDDGRCYSPSYYDDHSDPRMQDCKPNHWDCPAGYTQAPDGDEEWCYADEPPPETRDLIEWPSSEFGYSWYPYDGLVYYNWSGTYKCAWPDDCDYHQNFINCPEGGDFFDDPICDYREHFMAYCDTIVQVVTPSGENKAWAGKLNSQNSDFAYEPNDLVGSLSGTVQDIRDFLGLLGIDISAWLERIFTTLENVGHYYTTDYAPFGSIVAPVPEGDPTEWSAMPIDKAYCPLDILDRNIGAEECVGSKDCQNRGRCIPKGDIPGLISLAEDYCDCASLSAYKQAGPEFVAVAAYILFGTAWDGNGNIPLSVELPNKLYPPPYQPRLGIPLEVSLGEPVVMLVDELLPDKYKDKEFRETVVPRLIRAKIRHDLGGHGITGMEAREVLKHLFAKSYGVWKRDLGQAGDFFYNKLSILNWGPEDDDYQSCDNGVREGDELCSIAPKVLNLKVNEKEVGNIVLEEGGFVTLKFNAELDANQLPLTSYMVDWGDGSVTGVEGVSMQDKPDENDPYIIYHYYSYSELLSRDQADEGSVDCEEDTCTVVPKVQVKDNWGWCNNANGGTGAPYGYFGKACQVDESGDPNDGAWMKFRGTIEVTE